MAARFVVLGALLCLPAAQAQTQVLGRADHYMSFNPASRYASADTLGETAARAALFADPEIVLANAPQFTVQDRSRALGDCYSSQDCRIKLEAFVRIRDTRITTSEAAGHHLIPPVCPARQHIPIAGNMQHIQSGDASGATPAGFQLSCKWDATLGKPACCFDVYTTRIITAVVSGQQSTRFCPESVCVPIEGNGATELDWLHLDGYFTQTATGSDTFMSITVQYVNGERTTVERPMSEVVDLPMGVNIKHEYPFRIGGQIPFDKDHRPIGEAGGDQYFFFKGDVDEVRLFTGSDAQSSAALGATYAFETYSTQGTCRLPYQPILSIKVVTGFSGVSFVSDNADRNYSVSAIFTGTDGFDSSTKTYNRSKSSLPGYQQPGSGASTSPMPFLGSNEPFLDNVQFVGTADRVDAILCSPPQRTYSDPTSWDSDFPACSSYMDRPSFVTRGRDSSDEVTLERRSTSQGVRDYWVLTEGKAGTMIHVGLEDLNRLDSVGFRISSSACQEGYMCLDLNANVLPYTSEVFNFGVIWNIPGKTAQTFQARPTIPATTRWTEAGLGNIFPASVVAACGSPSGDTNCDGLIIEWPNPNLTSSEFTSFSPSGENWFDHCPLEMATDARYKLLCVEWYIPAGRGYPVKMDFQEEMTCPSATSLQQIMTTTYHAYISYEAPPEWLANDEYPLITAQGSDSGLSGLAECEIEGSLHQVAVSKELNLKFRARDRNLDDSVDIRPRDDPGLPNGAELNPPVDQRASRVATVTTRPTTFQRELRFTPSYLQLNTTYEVCFRAESYADDASYVYPVGKQSTLDDASLPNVLRDRCVFIQVVVPDIRFDSSCEQDGTFAFTVGDKTCTQSVSFVANDLGNGGGPNCQQSQVCGKYEVLMMKDPENPGPAGLVLERERTEAGLSEYTVTWTPEAGVDENADGYRTCIIAYAQDDDGNILSQDKCCFTATVQKCKYCMALGETLESVARRYGTDWLQLYMANPHIRDPDSIADSERLVNLGVLYTVRAGDYLELLSQRFFQGVDGIRRLNPDVPESGLISPGQEICVIPPVCDVDCLYGTDCHIY